VSYAIGVGGAQAIALIGHNDCGMRNLDSRKEAFIQGMIDRAGWTRAEAEAHFAEHRDTFEIGEETSFLLKESARLRALYPKIPVAPMFYNVHSNELFLVLDDQI
jgi:carbonic anhydrase